MTLDKEKIKAGDKFFLKKQIQRGFSALNPGVELIVEQVVPNQFIVLNKSDCSLGEAELVSIRFFEIEVYLEVLGHDENQ